MDRRSSAIPFEHIRVFPAYTITDGTCVPVAVLEYYIVFGRPLGNRLQQYRKVGAGELPVFR